MNERIKEIAKQVPNWTYKGVYLGPYPTSIEQFAQLIIQECITVTKNVENGYSDYRNQIEDGMREAIISSIEHHFGVNNEPKV